jgi:hypothetical protein
LQLPVEKHAESRSQRKCMSAKNAKVTGEVNFYRPVSIAASTSGWVLT